MNRLPIRYTLRSSVVLAVVGTVLATLMLGLRLPSLLGAITGLRMAILFPLLAAIVGIAIVFGRRSLLHLLALIWFVPITTAGVSFIPITSTTTGWEMLLWLAMLMALVSGEIRLTRLPSESATQYSSPVRGLWIGLGLVTISSLLAIGRVEPTGYGEFRYAAIDFLFLLILANRLILNEAQLERWALWFLAGAVCLLVYQIGMGGYEFVNGRLTVYMMSLMDSDIVALPNKVAILAASCAPLALCIALGGRLRVLQVSALALYLVLVTVVFLTFSRGQMVAVTISSAIILLLSWRSSRGIVTTTLLLLGLAVIGIFGWILPNIFQSFNAQGTAEITYRLESFRSFFEGDQTLAGRFDLVRLSLSLLLEQPFGIGYGRVAELTGYWEHNLFMAVMNGSGVVGLAGLLLFFVTYTVAALKALGTTSGFMRWMCVAAVASIATMAVNGMSAELIYPTYPESSLIAVAIGLAAISLAGKNAQSGIAKADHLRSVELQGQVP